MFRKMQVWWLCVGCTLWACAGGPVAEGSGPSGSSPEAIEALPGASSLSPELGARLRKALAAKGPDYKARTHHLREDGSPVYTNRLILESSPYLIQHAHNPVNWYPWGDEAFETAKRLGRPVLLSVGYSTCHWCHVMERESFEDVEIARYMNENYVVIKVDREERPDVDAIYMAAVQTLTGRGGWPMTVWLTTDRKPFYGGTYFPARDGDRGSRIGFLTLLRVIKEQHAAEPGRVVFLGSERPEVTVEQLTQRIRQNMMPLTAGSDSIPGLPVLAASMSYYRAQFDPVWGGTRRAPKFPSNMPIRLLLRHHRRTGDAKYLEMATLTLEKMAAGGMHDQIGGGFHRYSTDGKWLVPHFEKMLYDNALLTVAYLEGYQVTRREEFAEVARRILQYVGREMTSPQGAFYSATDADSLTPGGHSEEGWFFTWTPDEMERVLGEEWTPAVAAYYGVKPEGNFEGRSILHLSRSIEDVAKEHNLSPDRMRKIVSEAGNRLYKTRLGRPAPLRDDKILTSWNGLMISAFAVGGQVLAEESFLRHAERAADFALTRLRKKGRLLRSYMDGRARHNGYLDDYAFLTAGLLDLYEATSNPKWLEEALALQKTLDAHYRDEANGGYFMTSDDHESLLAREKPSYDGAEPSGNSVALMNLVRLHEFTTDDRFRVEADRMLKGFASRIQRAPTALSEMLLALDFRLDTPKEIVIVTPGSRAKAEPFLSKLHEAFIPNRVLVVASQGKDLEAQAKLVPLLKGKVAMKGKTTAYVCENRICKLPTTDPEVFTQQILASPQPQGG